MPAEPNAPGFDPGSSEVNRLFDQTMRAPFGGGLPGTLAGESSEFPLIPGGVTEEQYWPLYLQSLIRGGFYNDRFVAGPPDPDSPINNTDNRLPGWELVLNTVGVVVGGLTQTLDDFECYWEYNSGAPRLRFVLPSDWDDDMGVGLAQSVLTPRGSRHYDWPTFNIEPKDAGVDETNMSVMLVRANVSYTGDWPSYSATYGPWGSAATWSSTPDKNYTAFDMEADAYSYRDSATTPNNSSWWRKYGFLIYNDGGTASIGEEREFYLNYTSLSQPHYYSMNIEGIHNGNLTDSSSYVMELSSLNTVVAPADGFVVSLWFKTDATWAFNVMDSIKFYVERSDDDGSSWSQVGPTLWFYGDDVSLSHFVDIDMNGYGVVPVGDSQTFLQGELLRLTMETSTRADVWTTTEDYHGGVVLHLYADGTESHGRLFSV